MNIEPETSPGRLDAAKIADILTPLDGPALIVAVRNRTGYTQGRLGRVSGMHVDTLAKIAAGDVTPTRAQRAALFWAVAFAQG